MSCLRTFGRAAITTVCVVLLGPPLAREAFYRLFLYQVPTPVLPRSSASKLVLQTLWITTPEPLDDGWDLSWLGPLPPGPSRPTLGSRAASEVARLWLERRLPNNRSDRDLVEAAVAVWLTRHASAVQLQQALAEWESFGREAVGISAASAAYFGSARRALQVQQVALLAGFLQFPRGYDSFCPADEALTRRALVLGQMVGAQLISPAEAETAAQKPLGVRVSQTCGVPDNGS